ncbi:midasin-like [Silene latifolia]|uniref:midasin-like n=1 Tax=Silene latifolia TaxID=37657 RepID=UPI003D777058
MSLDGSFCLHMELERLVLRCTKLSSIPNFNLLVAKGNELNEEEVVSLLATVFLHPSYTIPIIGCFRPIARKIVEKVIGLLKLVPQLRWISNSPGILNSMDDRFFIGCEEFDGIESVGVIEVYSNHGRFLDLHELAGRAFCSVLDLAPFLNWVVDCYYEFGGPPFARIIEMTSISKRGTDVAGHLRDIVWTSYRLLLLQPEYFSSRWNWCCFLDLVNQSGSFDASSDHGIVRDIRWGGVQILCVLLRLPNKAASFGIQPVEGLTCLSRWREFCWDVSIEKAAWYTTITKASYSSNGVTVLTGEDSMAVSGLELLDHAPPKKSRKCLIRNYEPFLMTTSMKSSFERVIMAVNQRWPVLLYGPPGCGKTALLNKLAEESGSQVLSIHMDEHIDGKTLVGSYVCTEQPGEFRWQPGPLTQAVKSGFWVVFENIDQSASDVQSILLPLLEGNNSFLTGYGEAIKVAGGFRLFSTISTSKADVYHCTEGKSSLSPFWRRVMVKPAASTDLVNVVSTWYPNLEAIAEKLTETFELLNGAFELIVPSNINSSSKFSLRDLLKWCKRITGLGVSISADGLSVDTRSGIYREAVDVFAAYSASRVKRQAIAGHIAKMWAVPLSRAETLYSDRPILQNLRGAVQIGRVTLERREDSVLHEIKPFVEIRSSFHVLERIACAVKWNEPILLVGETGTGKTTLVQNLAARLGQKLSVLNLSQQSDVADLIGGFKPTDAQHICLPLYKEFELLFSVTFSRKDNDEFLSSLRKHVNKKHWTSFLSGLQKVVQRVAEIGRCGPGTKRKRPLKEEVMTQWEFFYQKVEIARKQILASSGMIFSFVEGVFVSALRNGEWILLDEVNLAPLETLQRIIGVLDRESSSLCLAENGVFVERHPNFRLFACMNPATDAGKRDLPYALRSRFTEYFVDDVLGDADLSLFVNKFLDDSHRDKNLVSKIVKFYQDAKSDSEETLQDGANQRPQYSLRSLYRALEYTRKASKFGFKRALYDGFCMFFMTLLDGRSADLMNKSIIKNFFGVDIKLPVPIPLDRLLDVNESARSEEFLQDYVLTKSVEEHIRSLARAVFIKRYPVLLQGPTSSGKTSLVQYLAAKTGHEFVRINNHEHTDLQEYLGSYITDESGRLVFHEGVLVKAVRNGHWIVLDELNLAPSDVLEALNRLLDDNRELFVPELRETIRAHPDFMLFATQNPPTFYGGRKMLSRAFRNRFVELHVDEIPEGELAEILERRGKIPRSYADKMIDVMKELQKIRQKSKVFAGKHGFITPRDLFRWASRFQKDGCSYEDLAKDGYYLLAERLRDESEKNTVQEVLEKHLKVKLKTHELYNQGPAQAYFFTDAFQKIVQTRSMQRLFFLVERCYELREPVLLVGETGGGKTTACQLLSLALKAKLHVLNCHQYTETSDFLGGFYPIRERPKVASDFKNLIEQLLSSKALLYLHENNISVDIGKAPSTLDQLNTILDNCKKGLISDVFEQDIAYLEKVKDELSQLYQKWQTIFLWQDGPLVEAMKHGDLLLVDEISLADDSVLERLNSVLEPDRKLSLAEKGGPDLEIVTAHDDFFLLATMNPGGDFGKKELSPALRNRFTEIWVPSVGDLDELREISKRFLIPELHHFVDPLINFWEWYNQLQTGRTLTVRDLLAWLDFVVHTMKSLQPDFAFLHGAFLVLLDGLSLGTSISKSEATELREKCLAYLVKLLKGQDSSVDESNLSLMENYGWAEITTTTPSSVHDEMQCDNLFGINPFYIEKGCAPFDQKGFEFLAPTTSRNVMRVLRAMQLRKPVLLEGSPGVGKTSLISAIGKFSGHNVVRINLSDQTDIMDLLGSDLPIESEEGLQFAWSDGILLQALKEGSWVLLDEINLAQQSVLEGLNAILDHRAEVFIPELGRSFKCPSSFRVFACQNPTHQGGGRKGLPKSFLNRFTKVYVDELSEKDYHFICRSLFPAIPESTLSKLILFNKRLYEDTMLHRKFAVEGSPWEFNLRDVIRSCQIIECAPENRKNDCFLNVIYLQRMRTMNDRREVLRLYEQVFGTKPYINPYPRVELDDNYLRVGSASIKRNHMQSIKTIGSELKILPGFRNSLEAAVQCIMQQWLCILVGPTASGKTSMIRLLAHLTGNVLNEINLSSSTDISELLGSFEQYNAYRNFGSIVHQVEGFVNDYCNLQLDSSADKFLGERSDLITKWLHFSSNAHYGYMSRSDNGDDGNWRESLSLLAEIIELLMSVLPSHMSTISWGLEDLSKILQKVHQLQAIQNRQPVPVKFEWAAGMLIKAIENGEWIVLEDANLCNPTVLDRINSLAESNGSITVNECGNIDGKPLVLFPHPNFRMFLTVNPSRGNVSRAMRNRGIEIVMMQPHWLLDTNDEEKIQELELDDVKMFLALSNIPTKILVDSMAKAHIHARTKGLHLNVEITYLELGRWVHLFQQLLMTGNDLLWSLLKSWEHSYISSLGESAGWNIVGEAEALYLTKIYSSFTEGNNFSNCHDEQLSLCLPGGWPASLKLTDFVWYSKGACVQQDCIYLGYLGAQYASQQLMSSKKDYSLNCHRSKSIYLVNWKELQTFMYPKGIHGETISYTMGSDVDAVKTSERIHFAIDWVMEQVLGPIDIELNLLWFSWFNCQLQPFCKLFGSMEGLLKRELEHPIWKSIFQIRDEVVCHRNMDVDLRSMPLLDLESVDVLERVSISCAKRLSNAIRSVGLLRASLHQWSREVNCTDKDLKALIQSLQKLEEEVLAAMIESPIFDSLHQTYINLLEVHIFLWNAVSSSQFESLLVYWRALIKIVLKLRILFPDAIENVWNNLGMMSTNLSRRLPYSLSSEKSLLWAYGGHPSLPQSADIFYKLQQFVAFTKLVWPSKIISTNQIDLLISGIATSTKPDLRFLAMQGVCMTSCLDRNVENVAERLEEMYLMLLNRYESEKNKLEMNAASPTTAYALAASECCTIIPEVMCNMSGFETWMESIPIADDTSLLLDLLLLEDLSEIVLADRSDMELLLSGLNERLKYSCDYSIKYSSRTPLDFVPHQEMVWTVDAWSEIPEASSKVVSSVHAMWCNWHSSLWNCQYAFSKEPSGRNAFEFVLPSILVKPVKTKTVHLTMKKAFVMKDYHLHRLKLRVASLHILRGVSPSKDLHYSLLHAARSLFQQIISAHRKSFTTTDFVAISSGFASLRKNVSKEVDVEALVALLSSSRHKRFLSLVKPFIEPLVKEVYITGSSDDLLLRISFAWLRLGGLRFHLLLACDELDPALKYSSKYQKLVEKCDSLSLEIEVRQHCDYLAGSHSSRKSDEEKARLLEKYEFERKRLQKKIVFRSDPGKFFKLKEECREFSENVELGLKLLQETNMTLPSLISRASNWQVTANQFVGRLAEEYSSYVDIIQPIQVAVYEMKLGMSLLLTNALEKDFLGRIQGSKVHCIMDAIYSFMRFPHKYPFERHIQLDVLSPKYPMYTIDLSLSIWREKMELLKKLITSTEKVDGEEKVSSFEAEASLFDCMLRHVVYTVANTKTLDNASFRIIDNVFNFFTSCWKDVKVLEETKRDNEAQLYKFKPRAFNLDNVCEIDLSSLGNAFSSDSFSEWKELLHDEESTERKESTDQSESSGQWNIVPESVMHTMVNAHNQLFGSSNLAELPGIVHFSEADKIHSFIKTYALGTSVVKDLTGINSSSLDGRLVAEHVFRLCLEHEQKFPIPEKLTGVRNFYKDSNPPVVAGMIQSLLALREDVLSLLKVRDEDQGLQKILDITEMLLALPPSTSVGQALSGLQFLVSRVKSLQENGARLPLNDKLERILSLISSFRTMEFDTWETILDEVLVQFEMNAGKLWFPLYSVLHRKNGADIAEYAQSTLQSLEELIRTSSLGEFRRRLQLILSFYGQLNAGLYLGAYTSCTDKESRDILYNVFGFYVQSLPTVMKHIETSTRSIKKELQDLVKLCRWERPEKHFYLENSKRNRQKLKRIMQKYTDVLEQPVMLVLTQESARRSLKSLKIGHATVKSGELSAFDMSQFSDVNRVVWYDDWKNKFDNAVQRLQLGRLRTQSAIPLSNDLKVDSIAEGCNGILKCPGQTYEGYWSSAWYSLETICRTVVETAEIWKEEGKLQVKTRAFTDLLKLLESSGLSKHKSSLLKLLESSTLFKSKPGMLDDQNERCQSDRWFFLPAYNVNHLLVKLESLSSQETDVASYRSKSSNNTSLEERWRCANLHYFKSLASVKNLEQMSLNFHKDFNPDQVNRSSSFLGHLMINQMEQRATAYDFTRRLKDFREFSHCLKKLSVSCSLTEGHDNGVATCSNQHVLLRCMWQQKELFDTLCSTLNEESLMFETIQSTHLSTCQNIKTAADDVLTFIKEKNQLAEDSKAYLDGELLGAGPSIKLTAQMRAIVITKDMEQSIAQNFRFIRELHEDLLALREKGMNKRAIDILLEHLQDIFDKAQDFEKLFLSSEQHGKQPLSPQGLSEMEAEMYSCVNSTCIYITNALQKIGSWSNRGDPAEASSDNINSGKHLFDSYVADLQLDLISQELENIMTSAGKLANVYGLSRKMGQQFIRLEELLTLALTFCDGLLHDFLAVHQLVSSLTHNLAEVFACLFSEGYGTPTEDQVDDAGDKTEDVSGTGMGEGVGVKDVSDQITDENQLLGTSKEEEKEDASEEIPSKDVNGIEMEHDIDAPALSVSEDSADENNASEEENDEVDQVESEMGATGEDGKIADEKLWDKEEDKDLDATKEKYEPGSAVEDKDPNNRELRAKDDSAGTDGHAEGNSDASGGEDDDDDDDDGGSDKDETEGMNIDKEDMYADPTDIDLNEPNQTSEDQDDLMDVDQADPVEENENEGQENDSDNRDLENETVVPEDETLAEAESDHLNDESKDNSEENNEEMGGNIDTPSTNVSEHQNSDTTADHYPNTQSSVQTMWPTSSDIQNDFNAGEDSSQIDATLGNSLRGNPTDDRQKSQLPEPDSSPFQKNQPNPLRDLGDALQDWKERVKVSSDLPETDKGPIDEVMDEAADEYRYTSESDRHTDQALGPAMPDQMEHNISNDRPDRDRLDADEDGTAEASNSQDNETEQVQNHSLPTGRIDQSMTIPDAHHEELSVDDNEPVSENDVRHGNPGESLVSMQNFHMNRDQSEVSESEDLADELVEQFNDMKVDAGARWRNYELRTTRLSQELAEQLRLIMEPTLASKLQGDYRTGKRINMKKIIPYIASHYRKDKIWLRRTKPNKRDYQVVIVVDDSSSMSENCCGDFAIEALVTVCRAMSQLEVGKLAVTSFGKQGNVRLLHDFDQPFTGEAGMQMISSLTFKQENTINEKPMLDLLVYLNKMLEQAATNARTPSGQNPLQQLVLIIADGRFHENEKLEHRVRDLLNKNCMVAFIVLDNAKESILTFPRYWFKKSGELEKVDLYLNSFPFPYYIVLRNIEALPRTLADLLRQWFELMQNSRD